MLLTREGKLTFWLNPNAKGKATIERRTSIVEAFASVSDERLLVERVYKRSCSPKVSVITVTLYANALLMIVMGWLRMKMAGIDTHLY